MFFPDPDQTARWFKLNPARRYRLIFRNDEDIQSIELDDGGVLVPATVFTLAENRRSWGGENVFVRLGTADTDSAIKYARDWYLKEYLPGRFQEVRDRREASRRSHKRDTLH